MGLVYLPTLTKCLLSTIFSNVCSIFTPQKVGGEKKIAQTFGWLGSPTHQLNPCPTDQTPGLNHMISEANRKEKALKEAGPGFGGWYRDEILPPIYTVVKVDCATPKRWLGNGL